MFKAGCNESEVTEVMVTQGNRGYYCRDFVYW